MALYLGEKPASNEPHTWWLRIIESEMQFHCSLKGHLFYTSKENKLEEID